MMTSQRALIRTAGVISALFTLFHIMFFRIFHWDIALAVLDSTNRAIFLTFNLASILMVGGIAYFSLRSPGELVGSVFGRSIAVMFAMFYVVRIAGELLYFGFRMPSSIVILLLCAIPAVIFLAAAVRPSPEAEPERTL